MGTLDSFIKEIDEFAIAMEAAPGNYVAMLAAFLEDPDGYLDNSWRNADIKYHMSDYTPLYTEILKSDGCLYACVMRAVGELNKVNAYTESIMLLQTMIRIMTRMTSEVSKRDRENLEWSIGDFKDQMIATIELRETYNANRKATLGQYADIIEKYKDRT